MLPMQHGYSHWGGTFVCLVIRVEGTLVSVQFENLTIGGQQTKYVARDQLERFEGSTPQGTHEIKRRSGICRTSSFDRADQLAKR